jgi:hypothetical protein
VGIGRRKKKKGKKKQGAGEMAIPYLPREKALHIAM